MGKTQSTELGSEVNTVSYSPTGTANANGRVQMRTPKDGKKTKEKRPMSYPGSSPANATQPPIDNIPVFNRSGHNPLLAGRHSQAYEARTVSLEPYGESSIPQFPDANTTPGPVTDTFILDPRSSSTPSYSMPDARKPVNSPDPSNSLQSPAMRTSRDSVTQTFRHSNLEKKLFELAVDRLIATCPKYKDLRSIDVDVLDYGTLKSLRDVCVEMLEGHNAITRHRSEADVYQRHAETVARLEEQCDAKEQKIKQREVEIVRLKELVNYLRSSQLDPERTFGSADLEDRSKQGQGNAVKPSDDSTDLDDSARFRSRVKGGIYRATPLVIAEGAKGSKAVVKRTTSLKPVSPEHRSVGYEKPLPALHDVEPLPPDAEIDEKLKWLERSLARERLENLFLKDRLKSEGCYEELPTRRNARKQEEGMVGRYRRLEEHAIGRLYASIKHKLTHVSDRRRDQFICAVIETSYTIALNSILHFTDTIHGMLMDPFRAISQRTEVQPRTNPVVKPSKPGNRGKEASCFGDLTDLPIKQLTSYLQQLSDITELTSLTENVWDDLRQNFSDCASASLLNQPDFKQFLTDCCRLAWQMAVTSPPLYLSTESLRMDERIHDTLMQEASNAQIDHYLWPTLFDRKHGIVLCKGRVIIKTIGVNL